MLIQFLNNVKVFCTDCEELINTVLQERGLCPNNAHVHCGFDGGQGIVKIACSVTEKGEGKKSKGRAKYSEVCLSY